MTDDRWCIILAAGEGRRLQPVTRAIHGHPLPKQFASLVGDQTLLQSTVDRLARSVRFPQADGHRRRHEAHRRAHGGRGRDVVHPRAAHLPVIFTLWKKREVPALQSERAAGASHE